MKRSPYGGYYGEYHRRFYHCRACGVRSWADVCPVYRNEKREGATGQHHKQPRGMYDVCQYHYDIDLRLMKTLREAGYTNIGRDSVVYEGEGIFSMILWFKEPEKTIQAMIEAHQLY